MLRRLLGDEQGGVMVETLISFPVLLFFFLGLYMLAFILAGHLVVLRAADAAARAAVVILPDHPLYFQEGPSKEQSIEIATRLALDASAHLDLESVTYNRPQHFEPLRAEVRAVFDCSAFLASFMCGLDRRVPMRAEATLPYQQGFPQR